MTSLDDVAPDDLGEDGGRSSGGLDGASGAQGVTRVAVEPFVVWLKTNSYSASEGTDRL